jgi:serine/threonine-protein kinase
VPADWEILRALFEGALERPERERAAFLDEHTGGDEGLRREVESLLNAHVAAGRFLEEPALGKPSAPGGSNGDGVAAGPSPPVGGRLAPGAHLGPFAILERLGAGGMGEVYRARDTRLDRFVAIKVLAAELDVLPPSRERFEREVRAISRLSHPHICTVHDIGVAEVDGQELRFLVMELLDGETLAARMARGALSIDQSLDYAIDIADALVAAHAQGIIHRDLKPANVMVTSTGVKLLDFGLAKLRRPDVADAGGAGVSAVASLTSAGLIFGTVPYMSPEQLRGERSDTRTDVFAFGTLLYEMVAGVRPFAADSQAALIAAILERESVPVSELQPLAPASLDHVVRKCLAKNPDDRWQTVRDLRSELIWVREGRDRRARAASVPARRLGWRPLLLAAVPTLAALVVAAIAWRAGVPAPAPPRAVARLSLNLPPRVTLDIPINGTSFAIAPDGSRIAFSGAREGRRSLFIHTLATGRTAEIPNSSGALNPMFSPDSYWLAFAHQSSVKKVPAAGGPIQTERDGPARQMTWLPDGRILRGGGNNSTLQEIGVSTPITRLAEGEEGHHTPLLLPDGSLLFTILRGSFQSARNSLAVWPPNGREARELVPNATSPQLVGDDTLIFAQGRTLFAAGFDSQAIRLLGEPRALDVQVQTTLFSAAPMYALARNGTLVYAEPARGRRLVWVDRQGREEFVSAGERMYAQLRISPDGRRVATYVADGDRDLWVLALDGSSAQKLTSGPARDSMPVWSPDGSHIFFTTGEHQINRIPADRSSGPEPIFQVPRPERLHALAISPDAKSLLTHWDLMPRQIDLRVLQLGSKPTLTRLVGDSGTERDGRLSPDGRWLAYQSDESAEGSEGHIMLRPFPDIHTRQRVISPGLGRQPVWSRDGRELYYRIEDGTVMAVSLGTDPALGPGPPRRVVTPAVTLRDWGTGPNYDVSADGQRFLFIKAPELDIHSLTVILNWDVEVRAALGRKER